MSKFQKLAKILGLGGAVSVIIFLLLILLLFSPLALLFGLDLIGLDIEYNFKSFIGAMAILFAVRSATSRRNSD
jgi:hypothetical protein